MMPKLLMRYVAVGIANTAMGFAVILLLQTYLGLMPVLANAFGYLVGAGLSYGLNRSYTFRSKRSHATGIPIFAVVTALCYALNLAVLQFGIHVLNMPSALAQGAAVCAYSSAFYLMSRNWIFASHAV